MLFKIYNPDGEAVFLYSIRELAEFCDVNLSDAKNAYYCKVAIIGGFEVINYSH